MPTVMTHAVVGLGLGKLFTDRKMPPLFWGLAAFLALMPDLDVMAFHFGIPYQSPFGHRGFSHSLFFALLVSLAAALLTARRFDVCWPDLWGFFFVVMASHGILDAFTNGGCGIAFFWPFDNRRYFFPWQPIEVSPIGLDFFTNEQSLATLTTELSYVWLPTIVVVGMAMCVRQLMKPPDRT
jgi:inner membrane protein